MRALQFSTKTQKHASFKLRKNSYNRNAISYFIHSRRTSWSADLNTSQSTPNPPYYFTPNSKSTNSTFIIVTVPLGLWMLERPGELQLNHSWFNFRTVYYLSLWLHTVCTRNQFKHVDDKILEYWKTLIRCTSFHCFTTDERKTLL